MAMSLLADRLKEARRSLGWTLHEVERRTGIGKSSLCEFEKGKREPKLWQLTKLAECYQQPLSFFLDEARPVEERVLWRERPPSPAAEELEKRLLLLAHQFYTLEQLCGDVRKTRLPELFGNDLRAEDIDYLKAISFAREVRNLFSLGDYPAHALMQVLEERCAIKIFHLKFKPTGCAACLFSQVYGGVILLNSFNPAPRRNFDLAHELFHLITWTIFRSDPDQALAPSDREEKLASCFARNLLIPEESLRQVLTEVRSKTNKVTWQDLFRIANLFGVSVEALLWQIHWVFQVSKEKIQTLIDQIKSLRFNEFDRQSPPSRPPRFVALAGKALRRGLLSVGKYAEYMGISRVEALEQLAKLEGLVDEVDLGST